MGVPPEDVSIEIRSTPTQHGFGIAVFTLSVLLAINFVWIQGMHDMVLSVLAAMALLALGFTIWWRIERYLLRADQAGILERTGFKTIHVTWSEVALYRVEPLKNTHDSGSEPVLYDAEGNVLLRPQPPVLLNSVTQADDRVRFWEFVGRQLDGKEKR